MPENEHASWFRTEFRELQEIYGKSGDELRLAMYQKGFTLLREVMDTSMPSWRDKRKAINDVLKMIEYSQGWIVDENLTLK